MSNVKALGAEEQRSPSLEEIKKAAINQVRGEAADKAKGALVKKLRELDAAKRVVSNIEREIADLEASIEDGSFVG